MLFLNCQRYGLVPQLLQSHEAEMFLPRFLTACPDANLARIVVEARLNPLPRPSTFYASMPPPPHPSNRRIHWSRSRCESGCWGEQGHHTLTFSCFESIFRARDFVRKVPHLGWLCVSTGPCSLCVSVAFPFSIFLDVLFMVQT